MIKMKLWEDNIPNFIEKGEKNTRSIREGLEISTCVVHPEIDVYLPSKKNRNGQAILIIPGGGYEVIVDEWEGSDIAKWMNSEGITAIVLKYRLPHTKSNIHREKSPLLDAVRAMRLIRSHADEWYVDKDNIGVIGFSAGGHLASTLANRYNQCVLKVPDSIDQLSAKPDFVILIYPVISMSASYTHTGSRYFFMGNELDKKLMEYYSNEKQVSENHAPSFIVHSSDDVVVSVENSIEYYKKLIAHKVAVEMHIFQNGEHGFSLANQQGSVESWKNLCLTWLNNRK